MSEVPEQDRQDQGVARRALQRRVANAAYELSMAVTEAQGVIPARLREKVLTAALKASDVARGIGKLISSHPEQGDKR
jgi:hypothetical protein